MLKRFLIICFIIFVSFSGSIPSGYCRELTPEEIILLRIKFRRELEDMQYYHVVTSFINLNISPDLSSSNYEVDNMGNSSINMVKLPFSVDIYPDKFKWTPFFQGSVGAFSSESHIDSYGSVFERIEDDELNYLLDNTTSDTTWTGYSMLAGLGLKIPFFEPFTIIPSVDAAWSYFENETDFNGPGGPIYQAILDGLATNWDLNTLSYIGSLRIDYKKEFKKTDLTLTGKYSYMYTDFYQSDNILDDFHLKSDIYTLRCELEGPFPFKIIKSGFGWNLFYSYHRFGGEVGDLMGVVTYYNQAGFKLRQIFNRKILGITGYGIGASYVIGDHIEGSHISLSLSF